MKRRGIAEAAVGSTVTSDQVSGKPDEAQDRDGVIIWAYGEVEDAGWTVKSYACSNPYAPVDTIAKCLAKSNGDGSWTIVSAYPVDLSNRDDPYGDEVTLDG